LLRLYKNCVLRTSNKWQPANLYKSRNATSKIKVFAPFYCIKTRKKVQPFPVQIAPQRRLNLFCPHVREQDKNPFMPVCFRSHVYHNTDSQLSFSERAKREPQTIRCIYRNTRIPLCDSYSIGISRVSIIAGTHPNC
jgi:hypothetical protein